MSLALLVESSKSEFRAGEGGQHGLSFDMKL